VQVALFVTCLVDLLRPSVGFAAVKLLEQAGCDVVVPSAQTCCGQPAYNNGDSATARDIARQVIEAFAGYPYVVAPSGSCTGMLRVHYPALFEPGSEWQGRALELAGRCHELVGFLTDVLGVETTAARFPGTVTYHDSCSSLRELGVREQPRRLLAGVEGLSLTELPDAEACCGFGGTFCVKFPDISGRMVTDKVRNIEATGAGAVLAGDMGCLLNIAGRLKRLDSPVRVYHVAEVLAGMAQRSGIGDGEDS
jgi:L-lactate dehydrogenase complex protein LldE